MSKEKDNSKLKVRRDCSNIKECSLDPCCGCIDFFIFDFLHKTSNQKGKTMKVLEKGRSQKGWAQECICSGAGNGNGGCGAKLLVEQEDVYQTHRYDYGGGHETYNTFRCPECGIQTDIDNVPFTPRCDENSFTGFRD